MWERIGKGREDGGEVFLKKGGGTILDPRASRLSDKFDPKKVTII